MQTFCPDKLVSVRRSSAGRESSWDPPCKSPLLPPAACSAALSAAGLAGRAVGPLWKLGVSSTPVLLGLLELLSNVASSSRAARLSWAPPGQVAPPLSVWAGWYLLSVLFVWAGWLRWLSWQPPSAACCAHALVASMADTPLHAGAKDAGLLGRLMAAVLRPALPLAAHRQACATLCCFVASPDGCGAVLRAELPQQALRALQDYSAAKDHARLEGMLRVGGRAGGRMGGRVGE